MDNLEQSFASTARVLNMATQDILAEENYQLQRAIEESTCEQDRILRVTTSLAIAEEMAIKASLKHATELKEVHDQHFARLHHVLKQHHMIARTVPQDGDCFFNATIEQLCGTPYEEMYPEELRNDLCDHLEKYEFMYIAFLECTAEFSNTTNFRNQVGMLRKSGTWSCNLGDLLPVAMANMLQVDILLFSSRPEQPFFHIQPDRTGIISIPDEVFDIDFPLCYAYLGVPGYEHYDYAVQNTNFVANQHTTNAENTLLEDPVNSCPSFDENTSSHGFLDLLDDYNTSDLPTFNYENFDFSVDKNGQGETEEPNVNSQGHDILLAEHTNFPITLETNTDQKHVSTYSDALFEQEIVSIIHIESGTRIYQKGDKNNSLLDPENTCNINTPGITASEYKDGSKLPNYPKEINNNMSDELQSKELAADTIIHSGKKSSDVFKSVKTVPCGNAETLSCENIELSTFSDDGDINVGNTEPKKSISSSQEVLETAQYSSLSRKRKRNEENWERNVRKKAINQGSEYVNSFGKQIPAKSAPCGQILCSLTCRYHCNDTINDSERRKIFDSYYSLSAEAKNNYLYSSITTVAPKTINVNSQSHRHVSIIYNVKSESKNIRVCKKAFCSIHQIGRGKVDHLIDKIKKGAPACSSPQKGKHDCRPNKLTEDQKNDVRCHIKMFPAEQSHYSRTQNPNRHYLSPLLSIPKMHDAYKEWCSNENKNPVSQRMYREIFNSEFNFGFGKPRSDTCSKCDNNTEGDISQHKDLAVAAFQEMKRDKLAAKSSTDTYFITFDMQKTLPLPKLSTSVAFYLRQLWFYNLGIHLAAANIDNAYFHYWTENEAAKGVNEIGSSILAFLETASIKGGRLVAWSDSCAGQNKNFFILCLWQYLLYKKVFSEIHHKFPEPGHSYMDSDRDFGHVEQLYKKRDNIYSVEEYVEILTSSQKSRPAATAMVNKLFNVKNIPDQLNLINRPKNTDGEKIEFRDKVKWIKIDTFGEYQYKTSFEQEASWHKVDILRRVGEPVDDEGQLEVQKIENPRNAIKKLKYDDIQKQLKYIPPMNHTLYTDLIHE